VGPKGFFESLFDFSFKDFITPRIVSILYGLSIAGVGLAVLVSIINGFRWGAGAGLTALIVGAIMFFLGVIYVRVVLEVMVILFHIAGHVGDIAEQGRGPQQPPTPTD